MEDEKSIIEPKTLPYDSYLSFVNNMPLATHFYYMEQSLYGAELRNLKPFSHSGLVLNFLFTPFLTKSDFTGNLFEIDYDQKNLGTVADSGSGFENDVKVYKIRQGWTKDKLLKTTKKYKVPFARSSDKSYLNESKLYQYPYYYLTINDYINTPLMLNPRYITGNDINVKVSQPVSINGGYTIYVDKYKGDKNNGNNEGLFSASGMDLPTSSSQYAQFMANSKNTFLAEQSIIQNNYKTGISTSAIGSISGNAGALTTSAMSSSNTLTTAAGTALSGAGAGAMLGSIAGPVGTAVGAGLGLVGGMVTGYISNKNTKENAILSSQAQLDDLFRAPRNVSLSSSDILMTLDRNEGKLWLNRYTITEYYKEKLTDYWTLYGYKQNKLMKPNLKSRKYFNHIKTLKANIKGDNLDKSEIETIKEIYNNGVTFWHYKELSGDGLKMYQYHKDNIEYTR